jgi:hypothetical protein
MHEIAHRGGGRSAVAADIAVLFALVLLENIFGVDFPGLDRPSIFQETAFFKSSKIKSSKGMDSK